MKLNPKQERFCQEYVKDLNATQAAIRADYSEKTAHSQGPRLLENVGVQKRIAELKGKRQKRTQITADKVVMEIAKVAFADLGLVADWDEEGELKLKPKEQMSQEGLAALQMLTTTKNYDKDGNHLATKHNFRMHDKLKALELLSKHLGLLDGSGADKNNTNSTLGRLQNALSNLGRGKGS